MAATKQELEHLKIDFILRKIEEICLNIAQDISSGRDPELSFPRRRTNWDELYFNKETLEVKSSSTSKTVVKLSGRLQSMQKFGTILRVLDIIHSLIHERKFVTKRDIYYQDPETYLNQAYVDRIIDDVACMLEVPRWELHIIAACKGLVAGCLQFEDANGIHTDCQTTSQGVQIAAHPKDMQNIHTCAKFILVVEKDATFQKLLDCGFCQKMKPCILITGKGYPDNGTRLLLKRLWTSYRIPILILVDGDPHGIEIMAVYKFGSKSQVFENRYLAVPSVEWIGVWPEDIKRLNVKESSLIPMSERDLQKAAALKTRPYFINDLELLSQLDLMIGTRLKTEIQCFDAISSNYLCDVYLPMKISMIQPHLSRSYSS